MHGADPSSRALAGRARFRILLLLMIPGTVCFISCSPDSRPPESGCAELRVPLPRDIRSLDPVEGGEILTYNVVRQLYEGLVDYDPNTLAVVPRIAEEWSVAEAGLEWTFLLHRGVRFVDDPCFPGGKGREVEAADAKYSMERGLKAPGATAAERELSTVVGVGEYLAGESDHVRGIEALSPSTLVIRLLRPNPTLLHEIAHIRFRIVPREAVESYGEELRIRAAGSGPFRLASWDPLSGILLVRNRGYWRRDEDGERLPYVDALRFVPVWRGDGVRLYAEGRIDMMSSYVRSAARPIPGEEGMGGPEFPPPRQVEQVFFVPRLNTIFIAFDFRSGHPAVRRRTLREALGCAIPRPLGRMPLPARGLFPPGLPGYDPELEGQGQDLERARELLREAGCPEGKGLPPLRIAWPSWDAGVGNAVAAAVREIGVPVEFATYTPAAYYALIGEGGPDLFRAGWIADYPEPLTFLKLFYSRSSENFGRYRDEAYDSLFHLFCDTREQEERTLIARRLEKMLVRDEAAIFLHHERESQIVSPRVGDWEPNCTNPLNICFYERVRVRNADR
ncbi:MAG: ABC transporter substrate-binding protein [Candidatus Eisenbacteria bacterium]